MTQSDQLPNVSFLFPHQDRVAVSTHLPLAWSKSDAGVEQQLMEKIAEMAAKFKS